MNLQRTAAAMMACLATLHLLVVLQIVQVLSVGKVPELPAFGLVRGCDEPVISGMQSALYMAITLFILGYGLRIAAEGMWRGRSWAVGVSLLFLLMLAHLRIMALASNTLAQPEEALILLFCALTAGTVLWALARGISPGTRSTSLSSRLKRCSTEWP